MRIARSSSPAVLILKESTLFPAGIAVFFLLLAIGFFCMAADSTMRVKMMNGEHEDAGPASRTAWIVFGLGLIAGTGFFGSQRASVLFDNKSRTIREQFGVIVTWKSVSIPYSEFKCVSLAPTLGTKEITEYTSWFLSVDGPPRANGSRRVICIDAGRLPPLEPLARAMSSHAGLPLDFNAPTLNKQ